MNSAAIHTGAAALLAIVSLGGVILLAAIGHAIPEVVQGELLGSTTYLFGVVTGGAAMNGASKNGG